MITNIKTLLIIIGILAITNLVMLWFFTQRTMHKHNEASQTERIAQMLQKKLHLSNEQKDQYIQYRKMRDSLIVLNNPAIQQAQLAMIQLLNQPNVTDSMVYLAAKNISEKSIQKEIEFYRHFKRVKSILTPPQSAAFDSLLVRRIKSPENVH